MPRLGVLRKSFCMHTPPSRPRVCPLVVLLATALGCQPRPAPDHATRRAPAQVSQSDAPHGDRCPYRSGEEHPLWPSLPPNPSAPPEEIIERSQDASRHDRIVRRISTPTFQAYFPRQASGAAALVLPGGGYQHLSWDKEGSDIAAWLSGLGIAAFVVKYRLPNEHASTPWVALADAQRALRIARHQGIACGLDPRRIGVVGFSAGGHLASQLATRASAKLAPDRDLIDAIDARPDFAMLLYPVISMDPAIAHAASRKAVLGTAPTDDAAILASSELQVTNRTPPIFIAVSDLDHAVDPRNTHRFADALAAHGVDYELHRYADGGHGTGTRHATGDMAEWPKHAAAWLRRAGIIGG